MFKQQLATFVDLSGLFENVQQLKSKIPISNTIQYNWALLSPFLHLSSETVHLHSSVAQMQ